MRYTDIYPVFEKLKENKHVIFQNSNVNHVTKRDYEYLEQSALIEKINKDIEMLLGAASDIKYVYIKNPKDMPLLDTPPDKDIYLMVVTFQGFKYLFVKSNELFILINYGIKDVTYSIDKGSYYDFLPREGNNGRTILELKEPYTRFVVNTYSAFCGYCQIHLNVPSNQLRFVYNKDLHETLRMILEEIKFPDGEADKTVMRTVRGKNVYVRFVKVYNLIIVVEWIEGI